MAPRILIISWLIGMFSLPHWVYGKPSSSTRDKVIEDIYDFVIIGGGTAGLTVGDRLSESGKYTVLAIEYGYLEPDGLRLGQNTYNITSAPAPELNNRTFSVDVGCIVGGSSAVNGRAFQRGTKDDYNIWGELGGAGAKSHWNWENLLGYFKKAVVLIPPNPVIPAAYNLKYDAKYWGDNTSNRSSIYGMYQNTLSPNDFPLYEGVKQLPGINIPQDGGKGEHGLYYYMQSTNPRTGNRSYSRTEHWDGLNRPNYHLLTGTRVNKIIFNGHVAVGVQVTPRGGPASSSYTIKARKEVILAAGAIHTPQLLQLSGIGPAPLLKRAGIPVKVDLAGVGSNFMDHTFLPVSFRWGTPPPIPLELIKATPPSNGISHTWLGLSLPLSLITPSSFTSLANRLLTQSPAAYLPPNTHPTIIKGYAKQKTLYARSMAKPPSTPSSLSYFRMALSPLSITNLPDPNISPPTISFLPINIHPLSRGTVLIDPVKTRQNLSSAANIEPIVTYRALTNPLDLEIHLAQIRFIRKLFTSSESPFAVYNASEMVPGANYSTDGELTEWIKANLAPSVWHPIGTAAKMPRELGGVVDEELLVYGVRRLSVVDASIMPTIVGATSSMTVYAVAEKAADLIKARVNEGREGYGSDDED